MSCLSSLEITANNRTPSEYKVSFGSRSLKYIKSVALMLKKKSNINLKITDSFKSLFIAYVL